MVESFLGIFTGDNEVLCFDFTEKFDIAKTCAQVCKKDTNAATDLLLAIYLERFDDKTIDQETRKQFYEAFVFIISNPETFDGYLVRYGTTKSLSKRFKFTQKEFDQIDKLEGDLAWQYRDHLFYDLSDYVDYYDYGDDYGYGDCEYDYDHNYGLF